MNLYEKLSIARERLRKTEIKKSGYNPYSKYYYFELGDFLNPMLDIFQELEILSIISFNTDIATLTILDIKAPEEKIIITSPMSTAKLTACHEVQNLGAVQTYLRRYLYIACMEMLEHDACDACAGAKADKPEKQVREIPPVKEKAVVDATDEEAWAEPVINDVVEFITETNRKQLFAMLKKAGASHEQFKEYLIGKFAISSTKDIPAFLFEQIKSEIETGVVNA